jgi:GDP-L-fucose synthase
MQKKQVAILIPTRNRSAKIERIHKFWLENTSNKIITDCIIILDDDDEMNYKRLPNFIYEVVKSNGKRGMVYPLNYVASKYFEKYDYIGFWGDDHVPKTKDWNLKMYNILNKNKPYSMVYGNDLLQGKNLPTEIIIDSSFIKDIGNMVDPLLTHLYVDDYWLFIGNYINNIHYLDDVIIEHEHYSANKSSKDEMYTILNDDQMCSKDCEIFNIIKNSEILKTQLNKIIDFDRSKKRVLITGGCGFVGRHFSKRFFDMNWDVICVDNLCSNSSICPKNWPSHLKIEGENFIFLNTNCIDFFNENKDHFDLVIHLAAIVGGRNNIENNPISVAEDLSLDSKMFSWAVQNKPTKVVYFSSSAAYPIKYQNNDEYKKNLFEDMINFERDIGLSDLTYGWCKLTGEYLAKLAHEKHGLDVVCYRPFSGYGEDQHIDYPFPNIITKIFNKENSINIWSDSVRDFVYIEDVIDCVLLTMNKINDGKAINIGTGIATSFYELAAKICILSNHNATINIDNDKPKGVYYRVSNNNICESYGFKHKTSLEDGILKTLKYLTTLNS